jgi:hypothetical protein
MAFRNTIPDFQLANPLYAAAQVTFYTVNPTTGLSTGNLATLYANPTGSVAASNPQTLDSEGKFFAPVYQEEPVIAEVVGPNVSSHTTGPIGARGTWRGIWASGARYYTNDTLGDPYEPHTIYIATQDFAAGASFAADKAAGKVELRVRAGDTLYFEVDDPSLPASGEAWRSIFSEAAQLLATAPNAYARALVAATAPTVFTLHKRTAAGVVTQIGTLTFEAAGTNGAFVVADDVEFAESDEIELRAPDPRDLTLAQLAVTIKLHRIPS